MAPQPSARAVLPQVLFLVRCSGKYLGNSSVQRPPAASLPASTSPLLPPQALGEWEEAGEVSTSSSSSPPALALWRSQLSSCCSWAGIRETLPAQAAVGMLRLQQWQKKSPVDKCQKKSSNRLKAISRAVEPPWACHLPLFIYHGKGFGQNTQSREIVDMWGPNRANPSSSSPFPRHTN